MNKKTLDICAGLLGCLLLTWPAAAAPAAQRISLPEKLPLKLRYRVGETLYYRLSRLNNNFKMDGTKMGEMRAIAYFTRTRLPDDSQGRVQEKFTWKSFRFGQSLTPAPAALTEFKPAEDFSLLYSVNEELAIEKFDFSSLPRTMDGFMFMIMTWDAVTFDGLVRPTPGLRIPDEAPIGAEFKSTTGPRDFRFSFPPLVTDSKYSFSANGWVRLAGISRVKDIPCALFMAAELENGAEMNLHLKPVEIKIRGLEHFWANTYLSLVDGRVVKGELVGPVAMTQDVQITGREKPERSEFLAIGYLDMDVLSEEEFNSELIKIRATPGQK
jgi:hypothetical protein